MRERFNPRPRAGGDDFGVQFEHFGSVSIHAPARGATILRATLTAGLLVSIHAPARGATRSAIRITRGLAGFNPRPRAGGDERRSSQLPRDLQFQSTPPRGGRLLALREDRLHHLFQSTPPRGGRPILTSSEGRDQMVSIHAPARGATRARPSISRAPCRFNPRPRAGGDLECAGDVHSHELFQSTPPRGGRPLIC